jgi:CheY-specific phosphatase CheX
MCLLTQTPPDEKVRIRRVMASVHGEALRLLDDWIGVSPAASPRRPSGAAVRRPLVSLFPVEGSVDGVIALAGEESAVRAIMYKMIGQPEPEEDQQELLQETLLEILNIMVGNATDSLRREGLPIHVFPPYAASAGTADSLFADAAFTRRIDTAAGPMVLSFSTNGR